MRLFVVGVNHKTASIEVRERVAFNPAQSRQWAAWLMAQEIAHEAVILSTCNRTEIYGVSQDARTGAARVQDLLVGHRRLDPTTARDSFYQLFDVPVARHLFRVAASLDSMVVGEPQILGQVRQAHRLALDHGTTGLLTDALFQQAARAGQRVRRETRLGQGCVSISSVVIQLVKSLIEDLSSSQVLVLGSGKMGTSTIRDLAGAGANNIRVTGRSVEPGERVNDLPARAIAWNEYPQAIGECDLIISALATERHALTREQIQHIMAGRPGRPLFFIDLGVPRTIDPAARSLPAVVLYDLDDVNRIITANRQEREKHIPEAERVVEDEVRKFVSHHQAASHRPTASLAAFVPPGPQPVDCYSF
jgi:glutamyl-tRNA reductase